MSNRNPIVLIFISFVSGAAALVAGCGDETGGAQGGAGSGASGGGATVASASASGAGGAGGQGTGGAGGAGGAGGGAACHGDEAAWMTATAEPIPCQKNSDCCVIVNSCVNEAQVVAAGKASAAKAAWPYCDADCTDCIPPSVMVECSAEKKCVGYKVPESDNPPPELSQDHCGVDAPPLMMMNPALTFTCGG
jgi:hypothetical protein